MKIRNLCPQKIKKKKSERSEINKKNSEFLKFGIKKSEFKNNDREKFKSPRNCHKKQIRMS